MAPQRATISLQKKLEIIDLAEMGSLTQQQIAERFNVSRSAIWGILKRKEEYKSLRSTNKIPRNLAKVNRLQQGKYEDIDKATYNWLLSAKAANMSISGEVLQQKALEFARAFGIIDFKASNGWLNGFKKRFGLTSQNLNSRLSHSPATSHTSSVESTPQHMPLNNAIDPVVAPNLDLQMMYWEYELQNMYPPPSQSSYQPPMYDNALSFSNSYSNEPSYLFEPTPNLSNYPNTIAS